MGLYSHDYAHTHTGAGVSAPLAACLCAVDHAGQIVSCSQKHWHIRRAKQVEWSNEAGYINSTSVVGSSCCSTAVSPSACVCA